MEKRSKQNSEKNTKSEYSYGFSPLAMRDIDEALSYIAGELLNPAAASDLYDKIFASIDICRLFPYGIPDCSVYGLSDPSYRHKKIDNYVLFFKICEDEKKLWIVRFLYSARDIHSDFLIK